MADPISVPIPTDPDELAALAFDYMEANVPDWDRSRGDAASQVLAACAQIIASGAETAADAPFAILRYLGQWVDGLAPIDDTPAQTTATVTSLDALGHTIYDGTRFEILTSGDGGVVFFSVGDVVITAPATATAAGEVVLVAETAGAAGSGLPADSDVRPVDALAWIDTVTLTVITTGGVDAESDDEYLARWIVLRALSTDSPILAANAAALVKALIPGVGRTLALDNYDPVAGTYGHEKYNTVAAVDLVGETLAGGIVTAAEDLLEAKRTWGFVTAVIGAIYTTVDVAVTYLAHAGFDLTASDDVVEAEVANYLDPLVWSTSGNSDGDEWRALDKVYLYEAVSVVNAVEPVDRITSLKLGRVRSVTGVASTDLFTSTAHGYSAGDPAIFQGLTGGAGITAGTEYFVIASGLTADAFRVSTTLGGATINFTTDLTVGTVRSMQAADVTLAQPAALTRPGTITATGTAP